MESDPLYFDADPKDPYRFMIGSFMHQIINEIAGEDYDHTPGLLGSYISQALAKSLLNEFTLKSRLCEEALSLLKIKAKRQPQPDARYGRSLELLDLINNFVVVEIKEGKMAGVLRKYEFSQNTVKVYVEERGSMFEGEIPLKSWYAGRGYITPVGYQLPLLPPPPPPPPPPPSSPQQDTIEELVKRVQALEIQFQGFKEKVLDEFEIIVKSEIE
ncbi:hypothetical protein BS50DRAFT_625242 [Corynespora cassiicola Philippines]|uniref:Uncharacterized protein n=1 Tax=Corynespora cassiicola Philippines TaxID=1448308 RepID=A0A2T2N7C9_CORCC|nr:hypothetical protein BS50DRAFT_625242 [Corynespora cassiicola Philippines]